MDKPIHWNIPSTDLDRSRAFYEGLFGWKFTPFMGEYYLFEVEGGMGGGLEKVDAIPAPCIEVFIGVQSIDETLKKVEALGGKTVEGKMEIPGGMGFLAKFADPCGCQIGLWSQS